MSNYPSDPAAEFAVAYSLFEGLTSRVKSGEFLDLSEPFQGTDEFMRVCVYIGKDFEAWACRNVDFARVSHVWPYLLADTFLWAYEQVFGPVTTDNVTRLNQLTDVDYSAIMEKLWTTQT